MGLSVWRETSKKLTVYRVCYTPIETLFQSLGFPPSASQINKTRVVITTNHIGRLFFFKLP